MDSDTENGMVLRTGTVDDAAAAAALHAGQISEGFLTILGPEVPAPGCTDESPAPRAPFCSLSRIEGKRSGFLAGSSDVSRPLSIVRLRDGAVAAFACAGRLLRSWRRVLETLRHGAIGAADGAELLAVAVHPAARDVVAGPSWSMDSSPRSGAGGRHAAYVVVAADNETAIALYRTSRIRRG